MSSFNFVTILGRQPELGLIELESILGSDHVHRFGKFAAVTDVDVPMERLGGTVKTGRMLYRGPTTALNDLPIDRALLPVGGSKTAFALSAYGGRNSRGILLAAGLELKKQLKARGSVRLIVPRDGTAVSAAELHHNRVIEAGFELLVVIFKDEMIVARTCAVQDVDWYSKRDYGRPARSTKVGMLPPKLAQILVNTTQSQTVFDPFCGTGVILQEARLMGRVANGSDISPDMVRATEDNMAWLDEVLTRPLPSWSVRIADARTVVADQLCSIVTEGYLGPNLSRSPTLSEIKAMRNDLTILYRDTLRNLASQLGSGDEVSICIPVWRIGLDWHYLGIIDGVTELGYTLRSFEHVQGPLVYARDDQVVGRQLLLLRKT
jgi:hypothetical protein